MDVSKPRERIVSILNDNDCPSFAIRRASSPVPSAKEQDHYHHQLLPLPRLERPQLYRFQEFAKQHSPPSEPSTPPLLRHDSSSSSTSSAMDNSPSPITPEYPDLDAQTSVLTPYDALIQTNHAFLPSTTTITPLMDQSLLIAPPLQDPSVQYLSKQAPQFPTMPSPISTPTTITRQAFGVAPDATQAQQQTPAAQTVQRQQQQPPPKKNKYPCPFAQSHNCLATFTTSGHAARHGKKHTGEKGVHCPTCGKAFTRKDNMKQHERTHKNSSSATSNASDDSRKSKAAITKVAVAERAHKRTVSEAKSTASSGLKDCALQSPLSEVTLVDAAQPPLMAPIPNPVSVDEANSTIFSDDSFAVAVAATIPPPQPEPVMSSYPPLDEETLGQLNQRPMPPFPRTFSDLDTLAMAATYDPYHSGQNGQI